MQGGCIRPLFVRSSNTVLPCGSFVVPVTEKKTWINYEEPWERVEWSDLYLRRTCRSSWSVFFELYAHSRWSASFLKVIHGCNLPRYLRDKMWLTTSVEDLCGTYQLEIPRVNAKTYGLHSLRYSTAKRWSDLKESVRALDNFNDFKDDIRSLNFQNVCCII